MARPHRRRRRRPAGGADAAVVLQRRRVGAGAREVSARQRRLPGARPSSAVGASLRRGRRLRVREPGRDHRRGRRRPASAGCRGDRAREPRRGDRRRGGRDRWVHAHDRVGRVGASGCEGARLRALARPDRHDAGRACAARHRLGAAARARGWRTRGSIRETSSRYESRGGGRGSDGLRGGVGAARRAARTWTCTSSSTSTTRKARATVARGSSGLHIPTRAGSASRRRRTRAGTTSTLACSGSTGSSSSGPTRS